VQISIERWFKIFDRRKTTLHRSFKYALIFKANVDDVFKIFYEAEFSYENYTWQKKLEMLK